MWKLVTLWFAHKLDRLKIKQLWLYGVIIGSLTWVHEQLVSPQVTEMITEAVGDNPAVAKWIRIAIMVTGCLIGARTSQKSVTFQAKQRLKKSQARVDRFTKF